MKDLVGRPDAGMRRTAVRIGWIAQQSGAGHLTGLRLARRFEWSPRTSPLAVGQDPVVRTQAAKLRARLAEYYDDAGRADKIVISMPKGGYIPQYSTPRSVPARAEASIAVLPFSNISTDPENEHFSDGLTEELINVLASASLWTVVSRTSVFAFKGASPDVREIGAQLGADKILEGCVRRSGNQLRVTAQLVEVATGFHLSSRSYTRELGNVFSTKDELANTVASDLMNTGAPATKQAGPFLVWKQQAA